MALSVEMRVFVAVLCVLCAVAVPIFSKVPDNFIGHVGKPPLPGCETFHENQCQGDTIVTDPKFEDHRWFTPARGEPNYEAGYQDYAVLVGSAHVVYNADRTSATVTVQCIHRDKASLSYSFGGAKASSDNVAEFDSSQKTPLDIEVTGSDGSKLVLAPLDFAWNAPAIKQLKGDYRNGQKGAIVELFGWPHADIEAECAQLAEAGYLGVKVFPPHEQVMSFQPFNDVLNPWYFMYQPVSYRLDGRMGTRDDLRKLINTCRSLGVRMYADAVVNHMTGSGNDANPNHRNDVGSCVYFGAKNSSAADKSPFYTQGFDYTYGLDSQMPPSQEFPAVPYGPTDFHCERALSSWTDPLALNAGWLTGLTDLNTEKENVQQRIADYMTDLIGIGFSGFRIDAAKHIKPEDLVEILDAFRTNMGGALPEDFITWLEILLGGEADLLMCDADSKYSYSQSFANMFKAKGWSAADIDKVKIWNSGYPKEPDHGTCLISKTRSVIQNDDHDQQNPGSSSRDMQGQGCVLIKDCESEEEHRNFEVKLFQSPNGADDNKNDFPIRLVLSSFYWGEGGVMGMPDGKSDCSLCTTDCDSCHGMPYKKAYDAASKGYDKGAGQYTRVHRDAQIIAAMREWMEL